MMPFPNQSAICVGSVVGSAGVYGQYVEEADDDANADSTLI
jgi:hypothetical protein